MRHEVLGCLLDCFRNYCPKRNSNCYLTGFAYKLGLWFGWILGPQVRIKAYKVNSEVVLPIPLCMSSAFRGKFEVETDLAKVTIVVGRSDKARLVTAYKKKVLGRGTSWKKQFLLGRCRFISIEPEKFLERVEQLYKNPFFDLHYTSVQDFMSLAPQADYFDVERPGVVAALEKRLKTNLGSQNRSADILGEITDNFSNQGESKD